ncbi:MAG: rRNA pseudouridine synthase [Lachnospiraceae bacterium]|nr:rRNA pseudouridine synthase [Lachnospiraceae bacterium]
MRLDKYLSDISVGTRSECKKYIRNGAVTINGAVEKDPGATVFANDVVCFRGQIVERKEHLYYMFHKPAGCVSATEDAKEKTVLSYFPPELRKRLLIAGRLDKDTEGFLLLTDDGAFVHRIMHPKRHVKKTYYFEGKGRLSDHAEDLVKEGLDIGDETRTKPAALYDVTLDGDGFRGYLTITEGRYHQVKRMIRALGGEVTYLKRTAIGNLSLDETLEKGSFRELTEEEFEEILQG